LEGEERSGLAAVAEPADERADPTSPPVDPTFVAGDEPLAEPVAADGGETADPTSQDVREKTTPRRGEDLLGRTSRDHDKQVGREDSANHDERATSNGRTTTPTGLTVPVDAVAQSAVEGDDSPASTPLLDLFRETTS
jgi:hypothetical protein